MLAAGLSWPAGGQAGHNAWPVEGDNTQHPGPQQGETARVWSQPTRVLAAFLALTWPIFYASLVSVGIVQAS